jgi:hypothetical protein
LRSALIEFVEVVRSSAWREGASSKEMLPKR